MYRQSLEGHATLKRALQWIVESAKALIMQQLSLY
jgi:hypothetical protein